MRNIPRHIRPKPYNRAEEVQHHRIDTEGDLSQLEASLTMYRGIQPPHVIRYPNGHYEYETQH